MKQGELQNTKSG